MDAVACQECSSITDVNFDEPEVRVRFFSSNQPFFGLMMVDDGG